MNIRKKLHRALAVLGILTITTTATITPVLADSYDETTTADFNKGAHSNTQVTNVDNGELALDENTTTSEVSIPSPGLVTDGDWGTAYMRPKIVNDTGYYATDGFLYATWHEDEGIGNSDDIWFSKSEDGGETWIDPVRVDDGDEGMCEGASTTSILPDIAVNTALNPPQIYIVWVDDRPTNGICEEGGPDQYLNVWFSGSIDGGDN
ncbi:hypothetical protein HOG17_01385 [Candidatus Peregrinibacteria bacterium]|jgi:hypothetical protein|nr:hypothetical protein [Candidatus Peregrinibacteria bacterium]MBT4148385.1 hypothetical protein [Candidatus Peregrinibacteria bacterium]MBT4366012.1 hypothetical protein [Candidatus Peregrinibacteria bacterium]MBT4456637.1 hypothetical protein [Candidatus Peregrinibacteria bacterium]